VRRSVIGAIVLRPQVLIEGLNDVVRLGQRLSETKSENNFTIGEMADNFANRPFAGCWRLTRASFAKRIKGLAELRCCGGDDLPRIASAEKRRVGVHLVILQKLVPNDIDGIAPTEYTSWSR
jgi:hypothetical protein